jgi:hypothetical protein
MRAVLNLPAHNMKAQFTTLRPDSFEALARELMKSKRFTQLAPKTKTEGTRIINTICALPASTDPNHPAHKFRFGEYTARDLKPKTFLLLRDRKEDTPQEADDWLNWCQKIYAYAIPRELGRVETTPVRDVERFKQQSKQIEPWSREDIEAYRARWVIGTDQRLAFELFWNGAQRISDTWDISRSDIKGGSFDYVQFKGRTRKPMRVVLPILAELWECIAHVPETQERLIRNDKGQPFNSQYGFESWFRRACKLAGVIRSKRRQPPRSVASMCSVDHGPVLERDGADSRRQREHDVEVGRLQQLGLTRLQPRAGLTALALRTMAVAAANGELTISCLMGKIGNGESD